MALPDPANELIAYNYGERSDHTKEFVLYYMPRAKLLFEAEQGWVNVAEGKVRPSQRAEKLLAWIAEQKLDVERLVQSWPMRDTDREETLAGLTAMVEARKKK